MVEGIVPGVVFHGVRWRGAIEGSRHARSPVGLPDVSMTAGARFGAHIVGSLLALSIRARRRGKVAAREVSQRRQRSQQDPSKPPMPPHCYVTLPSRWLTNQVSAHIGVRFMPAPRNILFS